MLNNGISTQIANELIRIATNNYTQEQGKTLEQVMSSADAFINAYNEYTKEQDRERIFNSSIFHQLQTGIKNSMGGTSQKNTLITKYLSLKGRRATQTIELRTLYALAFNFQNAYRIYEGKSISEVLYVTDSGQIYKTSLFNLGISAVFDKHKGTMRVAGLGNKIFGAEQQLGEGELQNERKILKNFIKAIDEYGQKLKEALNGIKLNNLSNEQRKLFFSKSGNFIGAQKVFLTHAEVLYYIQNKGDLKEAYAYAIMTLLKNNAKGKSFEDLLQEGLSAVDALGAIFNEDLEILDQEYAVKGSGASLPGLTQFYQAAIDFKTKGSIEINKNMKQIENDESQVRNFVSAEADKKLKEINETLKGIIDLPNINIDDFQ